MSDVTKIYNYVPINDQIASSGQPSPEQFSAIKKAGYDVVINLALASSEGAVSDEDATGPVLKAWAPQMDDVWKGFLQLTKAQIG